MSFGPESEVLKKQIKELLREIVCRFEQSSENGLRCEHTVQLWFDGLLEACKQFGFYSGQAYKQLDENGQVIDIDHYKVVRDSYDKLKCQAELVRNLNNEINYYRKGRAVWGNEISSLRDEAIANDMPKSIDKDWLMKLELLAEELESELNQYEKPNRSRGESGKTQDVDKHRFRNTFTCLWIEYVGEVTYKKVPLQKLYLELGGCMPYRQIKAHSFEDNQIIPVRSDKDFSRSWQKWIKQAGSLDAIAPYFRARQCQYCVFPSE